MKKTRKIAAFIAAMAMMATLAVPFTAGAVNVTIATSGDTTFTGATAQKDQATHTYTAYQIFKGEYKLKPGKDTSSTDPDDYEFKVTGLGTNATGLLNNEKFLAFRPVPGKDSIGEAIAKAAANDNTAKAIVAAAMLDGVEDDSEAAKELADILGKIIQGPGTEISQNSGKKTNLDEGYYLVKDTYQENGKNDAVSRFILRVNSAKDKEGIVIVPKKSYPEVIKKVQENQDEDILTDDWGNGTPTTLETNVKTAEKWNDVADYNIGDNVPFQLYGSMPATLNDYSAYYYKFTDTLGSQFDQPTIVNVKVGNNGTSMTFTWDDTKKWYNISGVDSLKNALAANAQTHKEYRATATFMEQINEALSDVVNGWSEKSNNEKLAYVKDNWDKLTMVAESGTEAGPLVAKGYTSDMDKNRYIIEKEVVDVPAHEAVTANATTDGNCRVTWDSAERKLVVSFEDIKAYNNVTSETIVTVDYTAKLNNTAVIGLDGQENKVDLTYSNNPNFEYIPCTVDNKEDVPKDEDNKEQTDKTPEDKVVVFTYEIDINKIDGDTKAKLEGAEFTLSRKNGENVDEYVQVDGNGKVTSWTTIAANASKLTSDANGLFKIIGIDSGSYTLTETKAPEGYNLPAEPNFAIVLTADTKNTQKYTSQTYTNAATVLTGIEGTIAGKAMTVLNADSNANRGANGGVEGSIENRKGTELPSTGGIGTTLFYLAGGVMVIGAGIVLVTKKRLSKEED